VASRYSLILLTFSGAATPYSDSRPLQPQEFIQGSSTSPRTAITEPANTVRRRPSSSSSAYFSDDDADFDASFLEQLDHAEREAIGTLTCKRVSVCSIVNLGHIITVVD